MTAPTVGFVLMVSIQSGHRRETPPENSNPPLAATMTDNDALRQLQARIPEIERHHEEELKKLKVNHDELEGRVRRP